MKRKTAKFDMANTISPERKIKALEMVAEFANTFSDPRKMLLKIMEISSELLNAEASSVLLYDDRRKELYFEVSLGEKAGKIVRQRLSLDKGIAGYVARTGKMINIAEARKNVYFDSEFDSLTGFFTKSLLAVPIKRKKRLLGVIEVLNKKGAKKFLEEDLTLIKIITNQAAMTIDNARLYEENLRIAAEKRTYSIKNAFQTYIPPEVVEELLRNPDKLKLGGVKKDISVLFSDIKDFSAIAESFSPEKLANLINNYLNPLTEIVFLHKGTIDKYVGDSLMAFFGAPLHLSNHPQMAVAAALRMIKILQKLDEKQINHLKHVRSPLLQMIKILQKQDHGWRRLGKPVIETSIGINTGEVLVGNVGSRARFNYTVMGDNVNIAKRLEELTRTYKNNILISESTWLRVKKTFCCREIDVTAVKGRRKPIRIYEPLALWKEISPEEKQKVVSFESGLAFYREHQAAKAKACFRKILQEFPSDGPSRYYLNRISENKA